MAISWFVASSLIFVLGIFSTLAMVYGVYRERYLWMLPLLVLKAFSVLVCVATTVTFVYMMIGHNQYLLDLVAEHVTRSDYQAARTALRFGGGGLAIGFSLMALAHVWFLRVLYRCYEYLKDKYFWLMCRRVEDVHGVTVEFLPSPEDTATVNGRRCSDRALVNGHGNVGGPSNSVSNSTALTEIEAFALPHHATPPTTSSSGLIHGNDASEKRPLVADSCYTPIVNDTDTDKDRLWKAFEHTHV